MRTLPLCIAIALLTLLAGCATVGEKVLLAGTTGAVRFSAVDVDAAIVIAQQAKDTVAEGCFRALRNHLAPEVSPVVKGVVSAYMAARARIHDRAAGLAPDVHIACSPLIVDSASFMRSFGATIGAAPALP